MSLPRAPRAPPDCAPVDLLWVPARPPDPYLRASTVRASVGVFGMATSVAERTGNGHPQERSSLHALWQ